MQILIWGRMETMARTILEIVLLKVFCALKGTKSVASCPRCHG